VTGRLRLQRFVAKSMREAAPPIPQPAHHRLLQWRPAGLAGAPLRQGCSSTSSCRGGSHRPRAVCADLELCACAWDATPGVSAVSELQTLPCFHGAQAALPAPALAPASSQGMALTPQGKPHWGMEGLCGREHRRGTHHFPSQGKYPGTRGVPLLPTALYLPCKCPQSPGSRFLLSLLCCLTLSPGRTVLPLTPSECSCPWPALRVPASLPGVSLVAPQMRKHEVVADASMNRRCVDGHGCWWTAPHALALDLASLGTWRGCVTAWV